MPATRIHLALLPLVALLCAVSVGQERPKTLIVGFDGMDYALTQQFMDEGILPNLETLAAQGLFERLETSNPAQSPVSWAVFNTGSNPGKTGVGGFVSRHFLRDKATGQRKGNPMPQPMLGFADTMPADEYVAFPMGMSNPMGFSVAGAAIAFAIAFVLLKLIFRAKVWLALVLGLAAGAGGWYWCVGYAATLPADGQLPYEINPMQGTNFWSHLDENGVRLMGIQIASTFPPDNEGPNTKLLSGLGVKDISGSPGSWFIFTDDPWSTEKTTNTAGKVKKVYFEEEDGTVARVALPGPKNWVEQARFDQQIATLEAAVSDPDNTQAEEQAFEDQLRDKKAEYNKWRNRGQNVSVAEYSVRADRKAGTLAFDVGGESFTLGVGDWSDFIPVEFVFNERYSAHGVARFHVLACNDEEVRIFVPPINIDPYQPPEQLPISAPAGFSAELAHGIGHAYETLGWACMTNPLKDFKDSHFEPQSFLDDIVATMTWREEILDWAIDHASDWDVYYQVFSTTDRIGHMLMREFDPAHPVYDLDYASQQVTAWGRPFPLGESMREVYKEADRIVGDILARMDAGELGADPLLMIVADHGFTSFRRGVNLNNLLHELGYMSFKDGKSLEEVLSGRGSDLLTYVDWENTQAYSLGLGKVFINRQGREPKGIVTAAEYDAVVDAICADLEAVQDVDGARVVTTASRRDELFSGPWWEEGSAERFVRGEPETVEHDGFADIFLGYAPYYRVSWANTMGGLDESSITDNTNHWSGGHVSVDPVHVPGVFFANRPFATAASAGLIDIGPTVLARYGIDPSTTDMDGEVLPLQGLTP